MWYLKPTFLFSLISVVNLLNYIDRGIIPGASIEINDFIQKDIHTDKPDVYLGLLQSSFIIGFMVGSVIFSHMIHHHSRFTLTGIGCVIWTFAVMFSGISYYSESYAFLLFARIFSGFGEASMLCTIPPWIQSTAKPTQRGMWLGIFYTAIPVGTAIGYAYSAIIAESIGWQFAFWFEGFAMVPFIFFMFSIAKHFPCDTDQSELEKEQRASLMENQYDSAIVEGDDKECRGEMLASPVGDARSNRSLEEGRDESAHDAEQDGWRVVSSASAVSAIVAHKPSIMEELWGVVRRPVWIWITVSTAAQAAVLIGISTFGAAFVMGLGFFNTETEASTVFGVVISIAGMIATPLGGVIVDYMLSRPADDNAADPPIHSDHPNKPVTDAHGNVIAEDMMNSSDPSHNSLALYRLSLFIALFTTVGTVLLCVCVAIKERSAFLFVLGLGAGIVLAVNPAMNMAVMLAVPNTYRSFAIAINIVCLHAFGDVPAPVIIGLIKDTLAPNCVAPADADDDNIAASSQCRDQAGGLRLTMFVSQLWLFWTILGGLLAAWYAKRVLDADRRHADALYHTGSNTNLSNSSSNTHRGSVERDRATTGSGALKMRATGLTVTPGTFISVSALHSPDTGIGDAPSGAGLRLSSIERLSHNDKTNGGAGSVSGSELGVSLTSVIVSPLQQQWQRDDHGPLPHSPQSSSSSSFLQEDDGRVAKQRENVDRLKRLSRDLDSESNGITVSGNAMAKQSNAKKGKHKKKGHDAAATQPNNSVSDIDTADL